MQNVSYSLLKVFVLSFSIAVFIFGTIPVVLIMLPSSSVWIVSRVLKLNQNSAIFLDSPLLKATLVYSAFRFPVLVSNLLSMVGLSPIDAISRASKECNSFASDLPL